MSAKIIFGILLAGLLSNNYAVLQFLGTGTVMQNHRPVRQSLVLGLGTTVVMILCTLITWPINTYLLANASYLRIMAFMIVLIAVVELLHFLAKPLLDTFCHADFVRYGISSARPCSVHPEHDARLRRSSPHRACRRYRLHAHHDALLPSPRGNLGRGSGSRSLPRTSDLASDDGYDRSCASRAQFLIP